MNKHMLINEQGAVEQAETILIHSSTDIEHAWGELWNSYRIFVERPGRADIDVRVILERILYKQGGRAWTGYV
jgi:hypothetical protein